MTQPVGFPVPGWKAPPRPPRTALAGRYCRVEPIDPARHADDLFRANALDTTARNWTYMNYGPFPSLDAYRDWMQAYCLGDDPLFHAIVDSASGRAVGVASYMRIDPRNGSIEVGHINYSPLLQRKP
ncbi:MAG TPA: GNAT family N-acetyltransferase, partial [Burkholderiales bacterium]|nr:GNAT family N-acetyltransferase [Burkholderiales bacterium]